MKLRTMLFFSCWFCSAFLSALGFYLAGAWYGILIVVCYALLWLAVRNKTPVVGLVLATGINAAGILLGAQVWLMVSSVGASLAAWDLLSLERALADNKSSIEASTRGSPATTTGMSPSTSTGTSPKIIRYQNSHLIALGLALTTGLGLVFLGQFVRLRLSFYLVAGIVCLVFFCLERMLYHLQKKSKEK